MGGEEQDFDLRVPRRDDLGYTSAAYMLFDIIWTLSDGVGGTLGIAANWISNAVSFSLFAAACLIWFIYSETVQGSRLLTARYRMAFVTLPAVLVVVLGSPTAPAGPSTTSSAGTYWPRSSV